jgi:predicted aspartyl protease
VTSSYSRNVNLALDTGASITSISPDSILGLDYDLSNPKAKGLSFTASGTVETKIITLSKLSAIGEIVDNIDVAIQEFPEQVTNQNIQGLLGLNFLRFFDVNMCFSSGFIDIKRIKR